MSADAPTESQAKSITYCGVCSFPPEYCEFGTSAAKCRDWLQKNHPELVAAVYNPGAIIVESSSYFPYHEHILISILFPPEAVEAAMSNLSVDAKEKAVKAEEAASKRAEKEAAKAEREAAKKASSRVILKRVERTKRKHVIVVSGLEAFGLDLKKVAKDFGKKFACGSSVTKNPSGGEEIVVQGDLSDDILEFIEENYSVVPVDNIDQVEDKKKKKSEAGPA
ncbi:eIF1-like protein [Ascodesmis nigricans]|uniref:Translation machinery-associated protein 22 n=1 Tax=Ascodesmis nigricans TaxID=341454 RepID=A0A4S2MKC0_9PEZI|nr:eIF1-like protein [Ascodesmis nigricans]